MNSVIALRPMKINGNITWMSLKSIGDTCQRFSQKQKRLFEEWVMIFEMGEQQDITKNNSDEGGKNIQIQIGKEC